MPLQFLHRSTRTRGKYVKLLERSVARPVASAQAAVSDETIAQVTPPWVERFPEDLLHRIFTLLLLESKSTLAVCTVVCRSWNLCGTPILFRIVNLTSQHFSPPQASLTRPRATIASFLRKKPWSSPVSCTPPPCQFSCHAFCTPRLVGSLRELYVSATTIDFCALQSAVMQLTNLRRLSIRISSFSPLDPAQPYTRPRTRRLIQILCLCRADGSMVVKSQASAELTPQLLDVLLWFYHCASLTVESEGDQSSKDLTNLLSKDNGTKPNHPWSSKIVINQFRLGLFNAGVCFGLVSKYGSVFDFRQLQRLSVRLCPSELGLFHKFIAEYGGSVQSFKLDVYPSVRFPHPNVSGLLPDGSDELQRIIKDSVQVISGSCRNLQTAYFSIRAGVISPSTSLLCRRLWHSYTRALVALPSLKNLTIGLFLMTSIALPDPVVEEMKTVDETSYQTIRSFISGLDWTLLDRHSLHSQSRAECEDSLLPETPTEPPPQLDLVRVFIGRFSYAQAQWTALPNEEQAKLVRPRLSARMNDVLTFYSRPFREGPLQNMWHGG